MAKSASGKRQLKPTRYASFRLSKRVKHERANLPSVYQLSKQAVRLLRSQWKLFAGLVAIYMLLTIVVVGGLGVSGNIQDLKATAAANGQGGTLATGLVVFESLLTSSSSSSSSNSGEAGSVYQLILVVIFTLASLWALRHVQAGKTIGIKQSFYQGMYPLVPFLLVLFVVILQLLPLLAGNFLYAIVVNGGIALEAIERILWGLLSGLLILLSLYMTSSSVFGLYIATLPDMQPLQALRSAREIVRYRRFVVMRKVLALPILLVLVLGIIIVPLIIVAAPVAEVAFFVLSSALLLVAHSYVYTLYRELL